MLTLTLPWPPKELSPNTRQHWRQLAAAKKKYRSLCADAALWQGAAPMEAQTLHVALTFFPPTRRAYDLDNLLARMKSGLDGLADVLGVDDSRWSLTIQKGDAVAGMVKVEVRHV